MDASTEQNANLSETLQTHESYQSSSIVKENMEQNQTVCDFTHETVTNNQQCSESMAHFQDAVLNSLNIDEGKGNLEVNMGNNATESSVTMSENSLVQNEGSGHVSEMATDVNIATEQHPEGRSVDVSSVQVTREISRNAPPALAKDSQSSEYSSEYMLEHHTENVYMPEQVREEVNLVSAEQVYSTENISDDSHDNNATYEKVAQLPAGAEKATEIVDDNFLSEYHTEHENEANNLSLDQVPGEADEYGHVEKNVQETLKDEVTNSNNETNNTNNMETDDNVGETNDQNVNVNENISNVVADQSTVEDINEDNSGSQYVHNVKDEVQSKEVEQTSVPYEEQEADSANHPIEHIVESTEVADDAEIAQVSDPLSENAQNYGIPEDLEVTVQEGEYTIVEGPTTMEITTNPQGGEDTKTDGTLLLLENYENSEGNSLMQLTEEHDEEYLAELRSQSESRQSTSSQSSESKPRRGRKPTYDIPMHVLGHDISKPVESVPNGRALPKPRLGVKVPYRNLTSQIVSKAEIEKEIMERARLKQEQAGARGDLLFARKLTQRLARKIAPSPDRPKRVTAATQPKTPAASVQQKQPDPKAMENNDADTTSSQNHTIIQNDSDLLAILEGEGEEMPVLPKEVQELQIDESNLKMLEREIALQQLQELPNQTPTQRIYRGHAKSSSKAPVLVAEASATSKKKSGEKTISVAKDVSYTTIPPSKTQSSATLKKKSGEKAVSASKEISYTTVQPSQTLSNKENSSKQSMSKEDPSASPRRDQSNIDVASPRRQPVEIEPQVKVNMVLKTYSRKRKTVDLPESPAEPPKRVMLEESEIKLEKPESTPVADVYVTKSSRVIKRKVIWDPDEIPSRSPKATARSEVQTAKITQIKTAKAVDKNSNTEKVVEKKPPTEKVAKEKSPEKKTTEKPTPKKVINEKAASPVEKKTPVVKSDSPKTAKASIKYKKSRSEVDRLLMDEGAVKMLYDLKNNEDSVGRKKKDVYSVDKAHKEIIKKANQIKNDLEQNTSNESPKSLRKKEALTPSPVKPAQITALTERKLSKDSTRSSVHTPPGSPAYTFPHSQNMLIRRRSSSSISSSDEVDTNDESRISKKKSAGSSSDTPKPKRVKKNEDLPASEEPDIPSQEPAPKPAKPTIAETKLNQYKSFTVKKSNRHATIDLNYIGDKCYCTVQVLEELTAVLKKLSKDKDCNVLSITSSNEAFCMGLDYASLISDEEDVRKSNATELAERVRDFLLCLLNFPKVLVAGIQGECVGLGVTMLPLFDIVIASDTATFSTPYADLGCISEAGFLLSSPNLTNHGLAAELLFTTQKLTADDAFRRGLISKLCWPEKYNETLKTLLTSISKGSKQSLEATKKQMRRHVVPSTEAAIKADTKTLIEHWMSPECQKSFARVSENGD